MFVWNKKMYMDEKVRKNPARYKRIAGRKKSFRQCFCITFPANSKNIMDKVLAALDQEIKIPKKFVFCKYIKEIPKNNAGKIRYAELKELKRERIR